MSPGRTRARRSRCFGRSVVISTWTSPEGDLPDESRQLRTHLDSLATGDATTRAYVERLESMVDEERLPAGDDLIEEIERFLRDGGTTSTS